MSAARGLRPRYTASLRAPLRLRRHGYNFVSVKERVEMSRQGCDGEVDHIQGSLQCIGRCSPTIGSRPNGVPRLDLAARPSQVPPRLLQHESTPLAISRPPDQPAFGDHAIQVRRQPHSLNSLKSPTTARRGSLRSCFKKLGALLSGMRSSAGSRTTTCTWRPTSRSARLTAAAKSFGSGFPTMSKSMSLFERS